MSLSHSKSTRAPSLATTTLADAVGDAWTLARYAELGAQICREVGELHARDKCVGSIGSDHVTLNLADYPVVTRAPDAASSTPTEDIAALGELLSGLFECAPGPCPNELRAVAERCKSGAFEDVTAVERTLMRWVLHEHQEDEVPAWENAFLESPDSSGARVALRSSPPPSSKANEPASVRDELVVVEPETIPWASRAAAMVGVALATGAIVLALVI